MARGRGRRGGGRGRGRGGGRGGGAEDDDSDAEVQASMGMCGQWPLISWPCTLIHKWSDATGQNSNAGMLPPSDSDEDSEEETVPVKAKQVTVNQVSRITTLQRCCAVLAVEFHSMPSMQLATAGMLPPSDSEAESSSEEEEDKKSKTAPAGKPPRPAVAPAAKKYASCFSHQH